MPHSARRKVRSHIGKQDGFTLLEVLVALVLIGSGMSIAYTAVSGSIGSTSKTRDHTAAMMLARSKMDEILAHSDFSLAQDQDTISYGGVEFGFRAQARPISLLTPQEQNKLTSFRINFEEISVEVFWGNLREKQSYKLSTFRINRSLNSRPDSTQSPVAR
jgi:prepilin-type N-terminal cleavage/methylation domain-containing protein